MTLRLTEEEYADLVKRRALPCVPARPSGVSVEDMDDEKPKRRKYGERKVTIDGMKFDSQHEANFFFGTLVPRVKSGELKYVNRQVRFDLPGGIAYVADFVAVDMQDRVEGVYDAKSPPTRANRTYINKKKQMRNCLGVEIVEV